MSPQHLTVRAIEATLVVVPMRRALGTSAMLVTQAPLLLLDLQTEEGITGRAYLFCYLEAAGAAALALVRDINAELVGKTAAPAAVRRALEARFRLLGARGIVSMLMAGIDIACWDALAICAGLPLATLLGAQPRPIPAYNSNGLGLLDARAAADEALELVSEGFHAIKMRLGRPLAKDDLAAVRAVKQALPAGIALMADFNQALSRNAAVERCQQLDDEGLYWIEEPVRHDDYATSAELTALLRTPVQIGENFAGPRAMAQALAQRACDFVMPDLERIGGVSGWIDASALANVAGIELSSHLFPEVSAHLLASTPTAHWIEYVDWADAILQEPLKVVDGCLSAPARPGNGLTWDPDAVRHYQKW
ncbi:enolase C-terminal domain-like protein [Polaromonas sp. JS666]|uniref:enolase C-terminal domain-like protein n=1 Tax=Polaromonas sp. (strain JS666 / ATCC BAA-500) TaxID=296591 RepID=UPI0000464327|nr:enolase C-terminal domain-like protein [Polaromonas sp. JS666]ABE47045.1 mandelate racemase/muconate lactonizing enzyme [Polaromonas sp. JS666]